jgi:hypothetical protein
MISKSLIFSCFLEVSISVPGTELDAGSQSIAIPPNHEVFIKLLPEITMADENIHSIPKVLGYYFNLCATVFVK